MCKFVICIKTGGWRINTERAESTNTHRERERKKERKKERSEGL